MENILCLYIGRPNIVRMYPERVQIQCNLYRSLNVIFAQIERTILKFIENLIWKLTK